MARCSRCARSYANVGAYAMTVGVVIQLLIGPWVSTSVYDIPTIDCTSPL
jgi:carbon-monoxide dehydrogenase large subunit